MATVTKTWTFASTAENFTLYSETGGGVGTVSYDAGYTALKFDYSNAATAEDFNIVSRLSATQTWETWGVPAGATVTSVELTNVSIATANNADRDLDTANFGVRIINSAGTVIVANVLASYILPVIDGTTYQYDSFYSTAGDGQQLINATYQASNTNLLVELDMNYITLGNNNSILTNLFIDLTLNINYDVVSSTKYYLIT